MRIKFYFLQLLLQRNRCKASSIQDVPTSKGELALVIRKIGRFLLDEVTKKAKFSHLRAQFFKH